MATAKKTTKKTATKEPVKRTRVVTTKEVTVTLPVVKVPGFLQGFTDFVREQGVVGVAIGFVIGAQIKSLVDQFVLSFISPLLGLMLPGKEVWLKRVLTWDGSTKMVPLPMAPSCFS